MYLTLCHLSLNSPKTSPVAWPAYLMSMITICNRTSLLVCLTPSLDCNTLRSYSSSDSTVVRSPCVVEKCWAILLIDCGNSQGEIEIDTTPSFERLLKYLPSDLLPWVSAISFGSALYLVSFAPNKLYWNRLISPIQARPENSHSSFTREKKLE